MTLKIVPDDAVTCLSSNGLAVPVEPIVVATAIVVVPVGSVVNKDDDVAAVHVVVVVAVVHAVSVFVVVVFRKPNLFLEEGQEQKNGSI